MKVNEWAHITVSGRVSAIGTARGESYSIVETNSKGIVAEDNKDYLVMQQVKRPF